MDDALFGGMPALDPSSVDALRNFHKKYNKVLLDKLALERERDRLAEEREGLKSVLQQVRAIPRWWLLRLRVARVRWVGGGGCPRFRLSEGVL